MNRLQKALAVVALSLLAVGVMAEQSASRSKAKSKIQYPERSSAQVPEDVMKQLMQFVELRKLLFTAPMDCILQPGGVCVISVEVILVPDPDPAKPPYCVARFPETVILKGTGTGSEKIVVWSLVPPTSAPAGVTFSFFDDKASTGKAPGVIILSDAKNQTHHGALGDGTGGTPDTTKYMIRNRHTQKGEAVYLPVVVRTDNPNTVSQKVSMCGTPDPRIAND